VIGSTAGLHQLVRRVLFRRRSASRSDQDEIPAAPHCIAFWDNVAICVREMLSNVAQNWAPVASAGLASIAAAAAWGNVWQSRRQWLLTQRPVVVPQFVFNRDKQRIELHLHNVGPGIARGLRFCAVVGAEYCAGYAGPNYGAMLKSDELRIVGINLTSLDTPAALCVVTCLDSTDRVHVFDEQGRHRTGPVRDSATAETDPETAFGINHPDVDLNALRRVSGAAIRKETAGR
jgi:hypothetical protein